MLLVPCPFCEADVPIELIADGDSFRAPELLPAMTNHVDIVHNYRDPSS